MGLVPATPSFCLPPGWYFVAMISPGALPFSTQRSSAAWMPFWRIGARIWNRAEHRSPRTASAMLHSRHHVHPHELTGGSIAHFCRDVLVVIDGAERCDIGIAPAVIEDQLAARIFERL